MRIPFEKDFIGLPPGVADGLIDQLETVVYLAIARYGNSLKNPERAAHSAAQLCASLNAVFELAERLKREE